MNLVPKTAAYPSIIQSRDGLAMHATYTYTLEGKYRASLPLTENGKASAIRVQFSEAFHSRVEELKCNPR